MPSLHAWALAVDKFATAEGVAPPGGVWTPDNPMPPEFARHFIRLGFRWGAFFTRRDVPHLEWADEPPGPGSTTPLTPPFGRRAATSAGRSTRALRCSS